jgi:hypothetical protein
MNLIRESLFTVYDIGSEAGNPPDGRRGRATLVHQHRRCPGPLLGRCRRKAHTRGIC